MRVTEKGQVTIPKHIRDRLGIRPGSEVEFRLQGAAAAVMESIDGGAERAKSDADLLIEHVRSRRGSMALAGLSPQSFMRMLRD